MGLSKRVSLWSVEEVLEWVQDQHPTLIDTLHKAIIKHAISGRALLRLKDRHLELLGVEAEEQQQEILQDLLLLRVQEEINELDDICSEYLQKKVRLTVVFFVHVGGMDITGEGEEKEESMTNEERERETDFLCETGPVQMDEISFCLSTFS